MARAAEQTGTAIVSEDDDGEVVVVKNGDRVVDPAVPPLKNGRTDDDQYEAFDVDAAGRPINQASKTSGASAGDDDDDDDDGDAETRGREANLSEDESERDQPLINGKGGRHGESRASRRARQRDARARKDQENAELRSEIRRMRERLEKTEPRITHIEKRFSKDTASQLEANVVSAVAGMDAATKDLGKALREGDEDQVIAALGAREKAFVDKIKAEGARDHYQRTSGADVDGDEQPTDRKDEVQQPARRKDIDLTPQGRRRVDSFCARNDWFDPSGGDEDSQLVLFIDAQVKNAGYNPEDDDYWDELNKRLSSRLPDRFEAEPRHDPKERQVQRREPASNGRQERRGPMTSGATEQRHNGGAKKQVKLTPERRKTLMEIGVVLADGQIADPAKFKRMLRQYAEFDSVNS